MEEQYNEFVNSIEKIINEYGASLESYENMVNTLNNIKNKLHDDTLCLGAVGSFSSGKSTFLNSMIQKNLLPTDAIQGTTVSTTILKKSETNDLVINYCNGERLSYKNDISELSLKYGMKKASLIKKLIAWLKRLFTKGKSSDSLEPQMKELFLKLISNEDFAKDIRQVILNIKNDNIPYNIALVDTPGTESLNARHNEVTRDAIENICDAIVIIIPYDEPVSEDLINYINNNIRRYLDNCIFVVTKIELLEDVDELPRLMKVIKKRLENGLGISNPDVMAMPTLLYLKSVDPDTQINLLDDIEESSKTQLIDMYKQSYDNIYSILNNNRQKFIRNKLRYVCEQLSSQLSDSLKEKVVEHEQINDALIKQKIISLDDYRNSMMAVIEKEDKNIITCVGTVKVNVHSEYNKFAVFVTEKINNSCNQDMESIASSVNSIMTDTALDETKVFLEQQVEKFVDIEMKICERILKVFADTYKICGDLNIQSAYNKTFDFSYWNIYMFNAQNSFIDMKNSIVNHINSQNTGIFNKVKALFSKNIQKEKDYDIANLMTYLNQEESNTILAIDEWYNDISTQIRTHLVEYLDGLINSNHDLINQYSEFISSYIKENQESKEVTEDNINKVNYYIKFLKEDC
jgi:hypothetical protein